MNKVLIILLHFIIFTALNGKEEVCNYTQQQKICVLSSDSYTNLFETLIKFNVQFEEVSSIEPNDNSLYIIADVFNINEENLPKYYITYQTLDLVNNRLDVSYLRKLNAAIAVWDYSRENIKQYNSQIFNYYYLPKNYEHADPVVLPCFLPLSVLDMYKEMLIYSNHDDTEISSLIPVLFFHGFIQNPRLIVEAGVCLGYSSRAFSMVNKICNSKLIGLDNDPNSIPAYSNLHNSEFVLINDLQFTHYYATSEFKNTPLDVVFIDTSHEYEHTLAEITQFVPLLSKNGIIMFHDSYVTPLTVNNRPAFWRINDTIQLACVNPFGVAPAIKKYFSISFDESKYTNMRFTLNENAWQMIHYPFCNGLTILKKI